MLKSVPIKNLRPNPFRRLDEYPIQREKVEALKASFAATEFWPGSIPGRPAKGGLVEIAFGHHRLVALQESGVEAVEIIVRELSNEYMLQMMANENLAEYGATGWAELESVLAVIEAYGKGEVNLPPVPEKTNHKLIRYADHTSGLHPYTRLTVAKFLNWVRKKGGAEQLDYKCEVAFDAIDIIKSGLISKDQLKALSREQIKTLLASQKSIQVAEQKAAQINRDRAKEARSDAASARNPREKERRTRQAEVYEEQAQSHERSATKKAQDFGKEGAEAFRQGTESVHSMRQKCQEVKSTIYRPANIPDVDSVGKFIIKALFNFARGDGAISAKMAIVTEFRSDLSEDVAEGIRQEITSLVYRIERLRDSLDGSSKPQRQGTRASRQKALPGAKPRPAARE
jgi:ParB-like chromosome segregation protein Spo0J